jgi:CarD family transcriptional regulator
MATKSTAVKKSKTVTKTVKAPAKNTAANKNVKKAVPKAVAKKPVAKKVVAMPVKKAVAAKAKKPVAKAPAKPVAKTVVKAAALQKSKSAVNKAAPSKTTAVNKSATAKNMPQKTAPKAMTKTAPAKTPAVKASAKAVKAPAKNDMSVEDAVARVMRVVGNDQDKAPVKATATAATAKVVKADKTVVKPAKNDNSFDYKAGDMVVYPAHGVGQVEGIETLTIGGMEVTLYTITFLKDRMRLKLPMQKVKTSGLRPLSTKDQMSAAMQTMRGRARIKRVMWSRRAQEYEAKINSGSPVQVAEVLRDLRRNAMGAENSYSERQIFQAALERLASELAAIEKINETDAAQKLQNVLTEAA